MSIPTKLVTVDEFERIEALPENRDKRLELIHGVIVEKDRPPLRGYVAGRFASFVYEFVDNQQFEGFAGISVAHRMPGDNYNLRQPDISFRYATEIVTRGAVPAMPDLAIEVQSPDDSPESLRDRIEYYLRNGTRLGWIAYPVTRKVEACVLENGGLKIEEFSEDETLDGGDVLPGFKLPVSKVLPKK